MKIMTLIISGTMLFSPVSTNCQEKKPRVILKPSSLGEVQAWFSAWEFVSNNIYGLDRSIPVEFVFFDDQYVYSTSGVSVPAGKFVNGPRLSGKELHWKKASHNKEIILPNGTHVPIGLMSFASNIDSSNERAFFVMPLPSFWKNAGIVSKETSVENLVTGVFLHEFAHAQQVQNFGRRMSEFERDNQFKVEFSDDIVQEYFEKDTAYVAAFREETDLFYKAAAAKEKNTQDSLLNKGLEMLGSRQKKYFTGEDEKLKQIDLFFLTMEGIGQYSMYAWLTHPGGANIDKETAIKAVRRGKKSWSQDEGFALFLVLEKLSATRNWAGSMFGKKTVAVTELISEALSRTNR